MKRNATILFARINALQSISIKQENCRSVDLWQEIPDWSKFLRGRGLDIAVELLTCKGSFGI